MVARSYPAPKKTSVVLFRDYADPRILDDVIAQPRAGS
jgi:hypothetical protein